MRKIRQFLVVLVGLALFSACGGGSTGPYINLVLPKYSADTSGLKKPFMAVYLTVESKHEMYLSEDLFEPVSGNTNLWQLKSKNNDSRGVRALMQGEKTSKGIRFMGTVLLVTLLSEDLDMLKESGFKLRLLPEKDSITLEGDSGPVHYKIQAYIMDGEMPALATCMAQTPAKSGVSFVDDKTTLTTLGDWQDCK